MTENQVLNQNLTTAYHLGRGLSMQARIAIRLKIIEETESELEVDFSKFKSALLASTFDELKSNHLEIEQLVQDFVEYLRFNPAGYDVHEGWIYMPPQNVHKDNKQRRAILQFLAEKGMVQTMESGGKIRYTKVVRKYGRRMVVLNASILGEEGE